MQKEVIPLEQEICHQNTGADQVHVKQLKHLNVKPLSIEEVIVIR